MQTVALKVMKKQVGCYDIERRLIVVKKLEGIGRNNFDVPSKIGKPLSSLLSHRVMTIEQNHLRWAISKQVGGRGAA
jgi:hypothetical protein